MYVYIYDVYMYIWRIGADLPQYVYTYVCLIYICIYVWRKDADHDDRRGE